MLNIVLNIEQGINLPSILFHSELAFAIFKINFWKMKDLRSLVNQSGMITSYLMKTKYVIASFINFLGKPAKSSLFLICNNSKLKSLLIILAPCNSTVMVLRLQLIVILENQWSQNFLPLFWSVNLKLSPF